MPTTPFVTERKDEHLLLSLGARHFGLNPWRLLKSNPRELNFILACAAVLQKYDLERDEARYKFDLERDEAQRKFMAAMWGVEVKNDSTQSGKHSTPPNGQKQTVMTAKDIMRTYAR